MNQQEFGNFVRTLRKEKNLTQKQLGEQLHLTDKAISKWERGQTLPDLTMLETIAEVLEVSVVELMQCKRLEANDIPKTDAETILHDTVEQAKRQERKIWQKSTLIMAIAFIVLGLLAFAGYKATNYMLDAWEEQNESLHFTCKLSGIMAEDYKYGEAFYVTREYVAECLYNYHVMGVNAEGIAKEVVCIQERGMDLDRAVKLRQEKDRLYILFEGLDNEDPVERLYDGEIGADPQGFYPALFCYDLKKYELSQIPVSNKTESVLMDVFTYQQKPVYMTQKFRGLIGGLHLGFYMGEKTCLSNKSSYSNLFGDGGVKASGVLIGDNYYIAGLEGIYGISLPDKKGSYVKKLNLSNCYRSEMKNLVRDGKSYYCLVAAFYDEINEFFEPSKLSAKAYCYDDKWNLITETTIPIGISQIEWGESKVMISGRKSEKNESYLVDCVSGKFSAITQVETLPVYNGNHLDELENAKEQWVYVPSCNTFYYMKDGQGYGVAESN